MPKLKTHSGTKKRVRITKKGKVLLGHAGGNHFLRKKSQSRKRRMAIGNQIVGKSAKNMKLRLGAK